MNLSTPELDLILRNDLMTFLVRSFYELNPGTLFSTNPHIEVIASKLEACRRDEIKRLIINLPPRSLKSHCTTVAFPAFLLGHKPDSQIICASYGQELADKLARDCRTLMRSPFYRSIFPGTVLSPDKMSVNDFFTTRQGFRMATSTGGVLTGRGADFIIIDDPTKPEEALSETQRNGVNQWFDNTLSTRLNDKKNGVIIIVMQRLHQDDLVGHVQEHGNWEILSFPAIAEEDETHIITSPLGTSTYQRHAGDALHPEREPLVTLATIRETLGEYNFQSQYQQNPMPQGGSVIKADWFKYYEPADLPSRFSFVLQSWDTANKSGELNDYSVCTTWGVHKKRFYLLDVCRKRVNYPELKRLVLDQYQKHKPNKVLIEDKASGTQLIQELRTAAVFNAVPYKPLPGSDKVLRVHAQTIRFESGNVLLPRSAPWLDAYSRELTTFPGSKFDDQVDSTTQALEYLSGSASTLAVWENL